MILHSIPVRVIICDAVARELLGRIADVGWLAYHSIKHETGRNSGARRRLLFAGHVLLIRSQRQTDGALEITVALGTEPFSAKNDVISRLTGDGVGSRSQYQG